MAGHCGGRQEHRLNSGGAGEPSSEPGAHFYAAGYPARAHVGFFFGHPDRVRDRLDTMGTLIGLSYRANLLDENGELPEIEKPMLCDALATTAAALLGTTTTGAYIESAAGIEAGPSRDSPRW